MQAHGTGDIEHLPDLRQVVRNSFSLETYEPGDRSPWDQAYEKFLKLIG